MRLNLQKASIWKRFSAFLTDAIVFALIVVLFAWMMSAITNYTQYNNTLSQAYDKYEEQHNIVFTINPELYNDLTYAEQAELASNYKEAYEQAYEDLTADEDAMRAYNMVVNLTMVITSVSILLAFILLEVILPIFAFGNGQTIGKKVFGICVIRNDSVKASNFSLVVRAIIGKYTVETMIPVLMIMMLYFGIMGITALAVVGLLGILQIVTLTVSGTGALIHDAFAQTVVVDKASQQIFSTVDDLIGYKKEQAQQQADKQKY